MMLVGMDGRRTGPSIAAPPQGSPVNASLVAIPDQTGYLLFPGIGGVYDVRPGGTSRVTTGTVLAVGPTRWLAAECNSRARCRLVVIDRSTGVRYLLSTHPPLSTRINGAGLSTVGVISPDGATAAVPVGSPQARIEIIDLATGAAHASAPYRLVRSRHGMGLGSDGLVAGQPVAVRRRPRRSRRGQPAYRPNHQPQPYARPRAAATVSAIDVKHPGELRAGRRLAPAIQGKGAFRRFRDGSTISIRTRCLWARTLMWAPTRVEVRPPGEQTAGPHRMPGGQSLCAFVNCKAVPEVAVNEPCPAGPRAAPLASFAAGPP